MKTGTRALTVAVLLSSAAASAAPPAAEAQGSDVEQSGDPATQMTYEIDDGRLVAVQGDVRTALEVPAQVVAIHRDGATLHVARGADGVSVYDVSDPLLPKLTRQVSLGGARAEGFHVAGGQLWVVTVARAAVPLADTPTPTSPAPPVAPTSAPTAAQPGTPPDLPAPAEAGAPPRDIPLSLVAPGTIQLSVGAEQGVRVGDRFAVFRSKSVTEGGATGFRGEELVTVAEVNAVKEDSSLAEIGRTAVVERGDFARPAKEDQSASMIFPPREPHVGEVVVTLRPLVNAGRPLGFGVLAELEAAWWGNAYFFDARVQPLGLGWTDNGSIVSSAALLEGGYDGRALAVGLGAGISWVNGNLDEMLDAFGVGSDEASSGPGLQTRQERQTTSSAFTLSQVVRLGARDGLNLQLYNLLLLHQDTDSGESGFIYGGTSGRILIPVAARSDLLIEGGGGLMGYWFAGAGVASWIVGNGAPGSWKLSVSAGAAGISGNREVTETFSDGAGGTFTNTWDEDVRIAGPMVSVGLARRFGL